MDQKQPAGRTRTKIQKLFTLQFTVIFIIFLIAVLSFAKIANEVAEQETLAVDTAVLEKIHTISTPWLDAVIPTVTDIGGVAGSILLTAIVCGLFILRNERRRAMIIFLSVSGAAILNFALKALFERTRPDLWDRLVVEHSTSFPSGHAMASAALGFAIMAVLWDSRWRWWGIIASGLYMLFIAFTRLYLGVHYPTDILAGWCVSAAWVAVVVLMVNSRLGRISISKRVD